jgi:DNA-binding IclR family transcriptional regulator
LAERSETGISDLSVWLIMHKSSVFRFLETMTDLLQ